MAQIIWSRGHPVKFLLDVLWMSSKISIGYPLESTGCPVELLYWTSSRAEDLADCIR